MSTTLSEIKLDDVHSRLGTLEITPMSPELVDTQKQRTERLWLAGFYGSLAAIALVGGIALSSLSSTMPTALGVSALALSLICTSSFVALVAHRLIVRPSLIWVPREIDKYEGRIPDEIRLVANRLVETFGVQNVVVLFCDVDPFLGVKTAGGLVFVACWKGVRRQRIVYNGATA